MQLFVPGRVCLLGEHSDWAGKYRSENPRLEKGYTIVCGTSQGIFAQVEPHPDRLVLSSITSGGALIGPAQIEMQPEALLAVAREGGFWSYMAGVAYQVQRRYPIRGLVIHNDRTTLPIQKGLSSSAAICVLTARAFSRVYGLNLTVREEMELAYQGEITTPSRCGRMDQCCAFGGKPVLMIFDGDALETRELNPPSDLHLVIVDLRAHKDTKRILERLNACYPTAVNPLQQRVQDVFGRLNRNTVLNAMQALEQGDAQRLGALMNEAQQNFDRLAVPACPEELTAPALHRLLNYQGIQALIYGGKGIGSQGDGSAQLLVRGPGEQAALIEMVEAELGLSAMALTIQPANSF